ncbi:MAG: glycosyltransferase, partial [Planctomycetes bacterium]|nr:glycosyltransferase [Planctomycetota bacterium]
PDALVVIEHDIWPNLLRFARAGGAAVALVNARLSPRSLRGYRRLSMVYPWPPRDLDAICAQDEASAANFLRLGFAGEKIHVCGNLKFDNPPPPGAEGVREELGYSSEDWILVAGSTHEGEEEAALDALRAVRDVAPGGWLILVPRRIERSEAIAARIAAEGFTCALRSHGRPAEGVKPDVLLVDTIGELARISGAGDVVFVGGTLVPVGGHSVIEPASLGRPVVIGPWYQSSRSVVESFLDREAIIVAEDAAAMVRAVVDLRRDPERARELGRRARRTVEENLGAAERVLEHLGPLLEHAQARAGSAGASAPTPQTPAAVSSEDGPRREDHRDPHHRGPKEES